MHFHHIVFSFFPLLQFEYGAWVAADVAVFRLVPAQLGFIEIHTALPGVAAQIPTGCSLPGEAAGDLQVSLAIRTLFRSKNPEKIRNTDNFYTLKFDCPYFENKIPLKLVLNYDENITDRIYSLVNAGPQNYHNALISQTHT